MMTTRDYVRRRSDVRWEVWRERGVRAAAQTRVLTRSTSTRGSLTLHSVGDPFRHDGDPDASAPEGTIAMWPPQSGRRTSTAGDRRPETLRKLWGKKCAFDRARPNGSDSQARLRSHKQRSRPYREGAVVR